MGNVPTKEDRGSIGSYDDAARRGGPVVNSLTVREILNPSATYRKKKYYKDKEGLKEQVTKDLIVSHEENVDGGFLAPYGVYTHNQDYATAIVRGLISERRISPFYLPLQDLDDDWTDEQLIKELDDLALHAPISGEIEETTILDPNSKHYQKHLQAQLFEKALLQKRIALQTEAQARYDREKKLAYGNGFRKENIPSRDLLLRLYKDATECPICFLFYPNNFNYTRCCVQPICSECFVQIKRLDPHPPHDEEEERNQNSGELVVPKDLISEPAICPFCAMPNFGITYTPPQDIKTGINGIPPCDYKRSTTKPSINTPGKDIGNDDSAVVETNDTLEVPVKKGARRHSLPSEHQSVISTDFIRPDWERKLNSARMKLARRSAAATAIHASSLLMDETGNGQVRSSRADSSADLEQKMIEQALRLSLLEEEERKSKQNIKS
ncbi:Sip5 protein [Saccharomycopsis crataegensis]|uniref:Sip5 protein n=1 Tax=Saccharomycopsis crataegensis TaxID=43959 RepID=A0AAV5QG39_9ASCO|nr:Sip5 protein [Saccharomycopsis crataegensis]